MDVQSHDIANRDKIIDELFREMYRPMFKLASVRLNSSLAEVVVQDTFLIATLKFNSMMSSGNIRGWLMNVLKGEIRNRRRQQQTREKHHVLIDYTDSYTGLDSTYAMAADDERALWELEDVCIQGVGKEAFDLFKERYIYRIPIKEAAARHGLSESAYKNRTARIQKKLQKLLKN